MLTDTYVNMKVSMLVCLALTEQYFRPIYSALPPWMKCSLSSVFLW
jgi:hypothetical protein